MFTASTKKQNRILLVALVVLLLSVTALIAITGSANKKTTDEKDPPIESNNSDPGENSDSITEKIDSANKSAEDTFGNKTNDDKQNTDGTKDNSTDGSDNTKTDDNQKTSSDNNGEDVEVSVTPANTTLPSFASPIRDSIVLKEFSGSIPVFSYTMNDYRTHNGVDFACSAGTPVYAAADGKICEIHDDPMMGVTIAIEHSGGAVTKYKGLSEESLTMNKVGDSVSRGQVIGAAGDTALIESAEEGHVHFELIVNGEAKDPAEYMNVTHLSEMFED